MANDWIKMRIDLQTHPKVVRILSATCTDKFRAVGGLHAVWSVFDTHTTDGILKGYTPEALDHVVGWEGLSQAMIAVGWLDFDGQETLSLPEFTEHNGQSAKRRGEDQKRKRNERREDEKCQQSVRNSSGQKADKKRTREEKRREDINTDTSVSVPTPPGMDYSSWPEMPSPQVLTDWLSMRKRLKANVSQTVINQFGKELWLAYGGGYTVDDCLGECITSNWKGFKFSWLKNREASNAGNQLTARPTRSQQNEQAHRDYIAELDRRIEREEAEAAGGYLAGAVEPPPCD